MSTAAKPVFFSNQIIDTWSEGKKIAIAENVLTVNKAPGVTVQFMLDEAYRFVKTSDGSPDPHQLIGKVRTVKQLEQMGAEAYMNSCIYKDIAYDVEQGYLGRPLASGASAKVEAAKPPPVIEEKVVEAPKESKSDEELLSAFLLNNLGGN
ncbi:MAG: hypothetical protein KIT79_01445 [Deltaproteobacteria bacterium]|nr:hypothetical protein [Deltaproteobacteria bacterium]